MNLITKNDAYFRYLDAYHEAIMEFIINESELYNEKIRKTQNDWFFMSFYKTACSMMENGCDLSERQKEIIDLEMKKKNIPIPRLEQFNLSLRIFFKLNYAGHSFADKADIGDFFYLLANEEKINASYEEKFIRNNHFDFFHKE